MPEQPKFCRDGNCQNYQGYCHLFHALAWYYLNPKSLRAEKKRLEKQAREDPESIIRLCSNTLSGYTGKLLH